VTFPYADYERAAEDQEYGGTVIRRRLHDIPERPEITTHDNGFDGIRVNWDGARGSTGVTLGFGRLTPGKTHRWHRHTRADEARYVVEGRFYTCSDERGAVLLNVGEHAFSPQGTWHTPRTDPTCPLMDSVWWYLGATTLEESGYELRENVEASVPDPVLPA
jgi:uncharacterized cupin superfamily protein